MRANNKTVLGMILKGYPRVSEAFISNEILLLERLGFSIHIFSMRQPRESFTHNSVREIKSAVDYLPETLLAPLHLLLYHNIQLAIKKPAKYAGALKTAIRRFLRTRKSATLKHLLQAGYLVHCLLPGLGVVHFHAHFAHSPTSVAMFASRLSGLSFSFTAHAKDIYTSDQRQLREKISLARFVITCTEYNKRYLLNLLQRRTTPIHCIYHGIDMDLFTRDIEENNPLPPFRVLTVARLTTKKGLPTVYRAIRHLCDKNFPVNHTLIGDGEDREKILSLIKSLGVDHVTQWLGTQPHHTVLEHYRQADLFVIGCEVAPNGDRDGIPNVLIESMAMGVPVVATNVSAIPELVKDAETGLLVTPGNPEEMALAMTRLLTDSDLRKLVIPAARELVQRKFDNKILIQDLASIHRQKIKDLRNP
jgi:glycosyltransferase involved in cell wall biosynthesis